MTTAARKTRIEYGDFQTPSELAEAICRKLAELGLCPEVVLEPTCGVGAFVEAAIRQWPSVKKVIGIDINPAYLDDLRKRTEHSPSRVDIDLRQGDFFQFDWEGLFREIDGSVLILGNLPWVTNSQQGALGGFNLPDKSNFQNRRGMEALTGKSNFDISEWMLVQMARWLPKRCGQLAMLCKTSVARKFLSHLHSTRLGVVRSRLYKIDAQKHFGAAVEAGLLFCEFDSTAHNYDCEVFEDFDSAASQRIGYRRGMMVRDIEAFERLGEWYEPGQTRWRSGIKHDCSEVMELRRTNDGYQNRLGEPAEIESTVLFPLLKGSDIANHRIAATERYVIVTQKHIGAPTHTLRQTAPRAWAYLEAHADYLDNRKSRIYRGAPRFAVFGVGAYAFAPWKVAIGGLYRTLNFQVVGPLYGQPVVFDDTVYFLSFGAEQKAREAHALLSSPPVQEFLSAMIFWDEKRPIKTSILNCLKLPQSKKALTLQLL